MRWSRGRRGRRGGCVRDRLGGCRGDRLVRGALVRSLGRLHLRRGKLHRAVSSVLPGAAVRLIVRDGCRQVEHRLRNDRRELPYRHDRSDHHPVLQLDGQVERPPDVRGKVNRRHGRRDSDLDGSSGRRRRRRLHRRCLLRSRGSHREERPPEVADDDDRRPDERCAERGETKCPHFGHFGRQGGRRGTTAYTGRSVAASLLTTTWFRPAFLARYSEMSADVSSSSPEAASG